MTTSVTIDANYNGKPLAVLSELVAKRSEFLRGETTEKAATATAINVVTSLKALTKVAPWKDSAPLPKGSYEIKESTTLFAGFHIPKGGSRSDAKIVLRTSRNNAGPRSRIKPVMLIAPDQRNAMSAKVFVISTSNKFDKFSKNVNAPDQCWYVLAQDVSSAERFAEKHVRRIFQKEGGMARFTLAKAQAKIHNKAGGRAERSTGGAKQWRIAADAAQITKVGSGFSSGTFSISVLDALDYSLSALKGGQGAMDMAIMKAANRTAGIINKMAKYRLEDKIPTPFPEVSKK